MNNRNSWTSRAAACLRRRLSQVRDEDGFTIVEVVVTAAMVAMIAGGAFAGLEATGHASSELRHRSVANELAQQDQERLRGMSIQQLSGLNEPNKVVTLDGFVYKVSSTGTFLGSQGGSGCSDQAADYVQIDSKVDWQGNTRGAVTVHSIVSPPAGGTILVHVQDDLDAGQPGVTATVAGGSDRFDAVTDADGCAYFSGLALGGYYVLASRPASGTNAAWVTPDGNTTAATGVGTSAAGTKTAKLEMAQAGGVTATFKTTGGLNGEAAGLSWSAPRMTAPGGHTPMTGSSGSTPLPAGTAPNSSIASPETLYPFHLGGGFTKNYDVWAGRCTADHPTQVTNQTKATVSPNNPGTPATAITVPAMVMHVAWKLNAASPTTTYVPPDHIQLTDACGDSWQATRNLTAVNPNVNALQYPGQAYGTYQRICVDYDFPGSTPVYRAIYTNAANPSNPQAFDNKSFLAAGNTVSNSTVSGVPTMTITGGVSADQKLCSSP